MCGPKVTASFRVDAALLQSKEGILLTVSARLQPKASWGPAVPMQMLQYLVKDRESLHLLALEAEDTVERPRQFRLLRDGQPVARLTLFDEYGMEGLGGFEIQEWARRTPNAPSLSLILRMIYSTDCPGLLRQEPLRTFPSLFSSENPAQDVGNDSVCRMVWHPTHLLWLSGCSSRITSETPLPWPALSLGESQGFVANSEIRFRAKPDSRCYILPSQRGDSGWAEGIPIAALSVHVTRPKDAATPLPEAESGGMDVDGLRGHWHTSWFPHLTEHNPRDTLPERIGRLATSHRFDSDPHHPPLIWILGASDDVPDCGEHLRAFLMLWPFFPLVVVDMQRDGPIRLLAAVPAAERHHLQGNLHLRMALLPFLAHLIIREASQQIGSYEAWGHTAFHNGMGDPDGFDAPPHLFIDKRVLVCADFKPEGAGLPEAWLPPGEWINYHTGSRWQGPRRLALGDPEPQPPGRAPFFVRPGTVLPMFDLGVRAPLPTDDPLCPGPPERLLLKVFASHRGEERMEFYDLYGAKPLPVAITSETWKVVPKLTVIQRAEWRWLELEVRGVPRPLLLMVRAHKPANVMTGTDPAYLAPMVQANGEEQFEKLADCFLYHGGRDETLIKTRVWEGAPLIVRLVYES